MGTSSHVDVTRTLAAILEHGWQKALVIGIPIVCVLGWVVVRKFLNRSQLKPHYLRLGQNAPDASCPCKSGRVYSQCCRSKDVEKLESDVLAYLTARWSRGSYKGRRSVTSMKSRVERNPLPVPVLPSWVTDPGLHKFPVPEDKLREWTPQRKKANPKKRRRKRRR